MAANSNTIRGEGAFPVFRGLFLGVDMKSVAEQFPQEGVLELEQEFQDGDRVRFKVTYDGENQGTATHSNPDFASMNGTRVKVGQVVSGVFDLEAKRIDFDAGSIHVEGSVFIGASVKICGRERRMGIDKKFNVDVKSVQHCAERSLIKVGVGLPKRALLSDEEIKGTTIEWDKKA